MVTCVLAHIFIDLNLDGSPTWTSTAACLPPQGIIYLCIAMVAPGILTELSQSGLFRTAAPGSFTIDKSR